MSKLLHKPVDVPEFIDDLPDMLTLAKGKNMKQEEQIKRSVPDQDQCGVQCSEDDDGDHDLV
jgi:hypothetical protein